MADDVSLLSKLPQMSPAGKPKDSREIPVGPGVPRRKKRARRPLPPGGEEEENAPKEGEEETGSGKVLDILI